MQTEVLASGSAGVATTVRRYRAAGLRESGSTRASARCARARDQAASAQALSLPLERVERRPRPPLGQAFRAIRGLGRLAGEACVVQAIGLEQGMGSLQARELECPRAGQSLGASTIARRKAD